jgi:hypothetical protein
VFPVQSSGFGIQGFRSKVNTLEPGTLNPKSGKLVRTLPPKQRQTAPAAMVEVILIFEIRMEQSKWQR